MPRIRQLPTSVITKIAAGEVIERPASVAKELLENAVDAGGKRIDVEIEQGGIELIRVVDDGCGIVPDDLPLAFASHATSKLANADDLFRIGSLGFRGEALASIGGVGQVLLQSRPADLACGAEITCQGGVLNAVRTWNGAPGTRMEVRHLFYNTPVRRKFLRTVGTETGHVCEAFTRLALAHAALHLTLRHNGKLVYEVPASAGLLDRIALFFGTELRGQLYPLQSQQGPATLAGYIADPACERGNAKMQYLFVNGRWIRDRSLGHAIQEAYRGLLMTGRYAVTFLFLDLPADQVDVNVHPTKAEVRFRDGHALHGLVFTTIRGRLHAENLTAKLRVTSTLAGPNAVQGDPFPGPAPPAFPEVTFAPSAAPSIPAPPSSPFAPPSASTSAAGTPFPSPAAVASAFDQESPQPPTFGQIPGPGFKAIQLYDAYLVVETPEGMLVIDQHALHERVLFEQLKRKLRNGALEVQRLLIPEPVDLSAEQAARALEHKEALAEFGLGVEDFGGGTILLTSYPAILGNRSPQATLRAVVDHLTSKERMPTREQLFNDLLSLMACHSAVRSGDRLTPEEISALVAQRDLADDTHHCPHGRPTSLLFSKHDLDRQFRRG
jgi:DNA mismatch repair protein MutL